MRIYLSLIVKYPEDCEIESYEMQPFSIAFDGPIAFRKCKMSKPLSEMFPAGED